MDRLFVGGEWVESSGTDTIAVVSPVSEEKIATVPSGTVADVDRAVTAARQAFDHGRWPRTPVDKRVAVLERFRDLYEKNRDVIAELITEEMGCPIALSRTIQATTPRMILEAYLQVALEYPFDELRRGTAGDALVTHEPVGVVAAVIPWNVPQSVAMQKVVPALLAGCTLVLKPAPETPLDAYLMAELLQQAGVPDGVVNVVPADREASEYLVGHPGVDKVTFTGSTAAGRRIAARCGNDLRRVTLELGGKSAAVFLDDVDLDSAVESLRLGSLRNSGQVCSLKTRLVVSRRREAELLERLTALLASMPVGDPFDEFTQIGPMAGARHRERVESYVASGREQGARVVVGGGRPAGIDRGWFVEPTVFADVTPDMRIAQEEVFGPVLSVLTYDDEDEAVAIANDSVYGLSGAVYTADVEHGLALARRIRTGTVEINGSSAGFTAPMGGFKSSGIGREAGREGLEAYMEIKSLGLPADYAEKLAAD
ncbi:aldehyde dehydrogenase [Nocardia coffeae]|uniref:aldehyde dehydrogenase n=1 Tax=Nocardia coffeae TaxID=2873381 RepID=UPI001F31DE5B|nr:aldehyde dehydrogenase [Nocardia coffeae]